MALVHHIDQPVKWIFKNGFLRIFRANKEGLLHALRAVAPGGLAVAAGHGTPIGGNLGPSWVWDH
jgi:hypothetical protein